MNKFLKCLVMLWMLIWPPVAILTYALFYRMIAVPQEISEKTLLSVNVLMTCVGFIAWIVIPLCFWPEDTEGTREKNDNLQK